MLGQIQARASIAKAREVIPSVQNTHVMKTIMTGLFVNLIFYIPCRYTC